MKIASLIAGMLMSAALALPAAAHELQYQAVLSGATESPSNASPATGMAWLTFDLDLATIRLQTSFSDLTGSVTAAHIHCCTALPMTANAGVATQTPSFIGFPSGVTSGAYDHIFDLSDSATYNPAFVAANGATVGSAMNALLAGIENGQGYLNIHTSAFPAGEIRGFLAPVPEPGTYAMMIAGLAFIGVVTRRRRARG